MITPTDMMRVWFQAWFLPVPKAWFMPDSPTWFMPSGQPWFPLGSEAWFPALFKRSAGADAPVRRTDARQEVRRVRPVTVSIAGNHAAVALLPARGATH